jgi:hypothetical protein
MATGHHLNAAANVLAQLVMAADLVGASLARLGRCEVAAPGAPYRH